jgi:hypothetical protein
MYLNGSAPILHPGLPGIQSREQDRSPIDARKSPRNSRRSYRTEGHRCDQGKETSDHQKQCHQGRNVKRMRGTCGNSCIKKLWFTKLDGTRVQCDTQLSMERACFEENETRFSQSEQTPPMQPPTLKELGLLGDTDQIEAILAGN